MDYSDDGIESGEENLYSDVEVEDNEVDYGLCEEDIKGFQKGYVVLKEEDIRKHQRDDIERVSTGLSISQAEAIALLRHYHWRVSKVEDQWFTEEERIRETVGILKEPVVDINSQKVIQCGICFESYTRGKIARVSCGHPYCNTCWTGYVTSKIGDGPGCLRIKCPEPSCSGAVGQDMIDKFGKKKDKEKYYRYLLRSYVEEDVVERIKWCPSPECECAIDFGVGGSGSGSGSSCYDITCSCSHSFCWNCREDAHSPVDCETVSKWIFKTQDEGENKNWMLAHSKPCPKCKRPIEKGEGCNHMICSSPCGYEFCWICLEEYNSHVACNRFVEEAEDKRKLLKDELARYMHYYERWVVNQSSRLKAISDLEKWQSVQLKRLSGTLGKPETELEFTVEAWRQIIECRRVLKWTYAYGYYLPDHEIGKKKFSTDAESGLERLHRCAETELKEFIHKSDDPTNAFYSFKMKLTDLTKATKTFFENLVKALENGLSDVVCSGETKSTEESGMKLYDHMIFSTQFSDEWVDDEW